MPPHVHPRSSTSIVSARTSTLEGVGDGLRHSVERPANVAVGSFSTGTSPAVVPAMSARPRNRTQNQSISAYLDGSLQVDGAARYVIQEPKLSLESCATKRRPAVVISPRLPHRDGLCTVIPMSGAPGDHEVQYGFGLRSIRPFRSHSATSLHGQRVTCWPRSLLIDWTCSELSGINPENGSIYTPKYRTKT